MGTELEYATINLLTESSNSSNFGVHSVDDRYYFLRDRSVLTKDLQVSGSSEKFISFSTNKMPTNRNVESIKKTMQMQEDIFKHQVRELHRLYSVQRMLMDELKMEISNHSSKPWTPMTITSDINHSLIINPHNSTSQHRSSVQYCSRDEHNTRERRGSCSGATMKMARGFDLERPAEGNLSTGISVDDDKRAAGSSFYIPQKPINRCEDSEVELTLSIGASSGKSPKSKDYRRLHTHREVGFIETMNMKENDSPTSIFRSERGEDCSGPTTPMSSSSATSDQERKRPHWLFQGLSINRT